MYIKYTQIYNYICMCVFEKYMYTENYSFEKVHIFYFGQITLHKLFPVYVITYSTFVGYGMMNEES